MNINLNDKSALVCGSTQGIGKAAALELALLGANVTLVARNVESLKQVQKELDASNGQKHGYICADFNFPDEVKKKIEDHLNTSGPVHILVNNTGGPPAGAIAEAKPEEFTAAFSNHLLCNHILVQAVVAGMKKEKYGRIINVISTSVRQPIPGLGVSNTIRGAVASWAKTLAGELGPFGITVNNVLPGMTRTARLQWLMESRAQKAGKSVAEIEKELLKEIPAGRFADSAETAAAIAFLASPAAAYINGINLPVDGGKISSL